MIDALRFEWVRLRTIHSTYWLVGLALLVNAAVALLVNLATRNNPLDTDIVGATVTGGGTASPLPLLAVFMAAVGILATGHEYRYGTIQPTLTTIPRRTTVLTAKLAVVAAAAVAVAVASMLVNVAVGLVFWGEFPELTEQPLGAALPGYVLLVVLWAVLGAALAQVFRSVPAALVVILVTPLVVEQTIFRLSLVPALDWLAPVIKFLPFSAGLRLVDLSGTAALTDADNFDLFGRWAAGGVFTAFVAIILTAAWALFARRDA
ncbi:ABC transporter permease [Plantactinospora sp. ZYX-F-223]|uniref:ABC transporter permease n=1 Tax=Plantactinospora sp. ZYX-F-223 TaxID=3144103 RepID=UPI0031FD5937